MAAIWLSPNLWIIHALLQGRYSQTTVEDMAWIYNYVPWKLCMQVFIYAMTDNCSYQWLYCT